MNIYEKLQKVKLELLDCNLKKSGNNKFAGFKYYELGDFMPAIIRLCDKYKVCTVIKFHENSAELSAYDSECEDSNFINIYCPVEKLEIRGANAIQAIGGTQTYMRRYLYMAMFDITENDVFDAVSGKESGKKPEKYCCESCGSEFKEYETNGRKYTKKQVYEQVLSQSKDGKARCKMCREKLQTEETKNA